MGKVFYYGSMVLSVVYVTILLIVEPHVRNHAHTFSFVLIIIYGYLMIWSYLITFVFVIFKKQIFAIWFNRVFVKFTAIVFPILALIAYFSDRFMDMKRSVVAFFIYTCIMSLFLIFYEIYSCTFAEIQNPKYIFRPNDLTEERKIVFEQR